MSGPLERVSEAQPATLQAGRLTAQDVARPIVGRGSWLVIVKVEDRPEARVGVYYHVEGETTHHLMLVARDETWEHRGYAWQSRTQRSERVSELAVTPAHAPMPLDVIRPGLVLVSPWHGQPVVLDVTHSNWETTLTTRHSSTGQPMVSEHDAVRGATLDVRVECDVRGDELAVGDLIIDREHDCWVEVNRDLYERMRDGTAAQDSYWDRAYVDPQSELERAQAESRSAH
jgi:hypothetical protein